MVSERRPVDQLKGIRHLALDLDGTLYLGGRVFEFSRPFLDRLGEIGIGHTFFTNNTSKSTKQYVEHLRKIGLQASAEDIYSSTHSTIDYLREVMPQIRRVYVLGTSALREEFEESGFLVVGAEGDAGSAPAKAAEPDAVVIGYDTSLAYERLCEAAWWISRGKTFLATNPDRVCPTDRPTVLVDCGAMCQMLTHATGVSPHAVLGKPNPRMLQGLMRRHHVTPAELGVVGDRIYTDIAMAHAADALGILVLSGETQAHHVADAQAKPDLVVHDVGELGRMLIEAKFGAG
jgi:HAD superfamily hydrolase (TIGR01450 family)